jgi:type I restriction enzyme, S subunit
VQFATASGINEVALNRIRKGVGKPGDILFSHKGTVGKLARVPLDCPPFVCSPQTTFWRVLDESKLRRDYLYAYMRSRSFVDQWWVRKGETDMADYVSLTAQRQLRVIVPPVDVQRRIAEPLAAIDDLIENNRRRVEVLEEMARAIYREWFVCLRYPGHEDVPLVDSPLGPIPDGWYVESLFDVADVGFGFSFKSKRFADRGPFPVVRIRDVPKGTTHTFSDEEPGERYRIVDGDVLIGMDGDFHLRQWSGGVAWLNQRVARLRPREGLSAGHLLLAVEAPIREWNAAITGTTVAHLGKRHLEQVHVLIPKDSVLKRATVFFDDVSQQVVALTHAARRLAGMRDLLPKLVTGQIDVSQLDLDALTEAASA